jgi:hypothetical protein
MPMELQDLRQVISQAEREKRTELDPWDKGLTELLPEVERLAHLRTLDLRDNPLPIPPEILARTDEPAAILSYYRGHQTRSPRYQ